MNYDPHLLEQKIASAKNIIYNWANRHEIWKDCGFKSWLEHYNDEPGEDTGHLLLCMDGYLCDIFDNAYELCEELSDELSVIKCVYEREETTTVSFWFTNEEGDILPEFKEYFEWQWICQLLTPDYTSIYEEIYNRFLKNPSELYNLHHRDFEKFLGVLFTELGYRVELGAGNADGGVDLRLFTSDVFGEVLTVVQAKKYKTSRPIRLEAVQALTGVAYEEKADQALFVTTSGYLPGVKKFAAASKKKIILSDSSNVKDWCEDANKKIIQNKIELVSDNNLTRLFQSEVKSGLVGRTFHCTSDNRIINNYYAVLLKETKGAALMLEINKAVFEHDGYGQRGYHIPDNKKVLQTLVSERKLFRVKKSYNENGQLQYLWGNRKLWSLWNGKPNSFDFAD